MGWSDENVLMSVFIDYERASDVNPSSIWRRDSNHGSGDRTKLWVEAHRSSHA